MAPPSGVPMRGLYSERSPLVTRRELRHWSRADTHADGRPTTSGSNCAGQPSPVRYALRGRSLGWSFRCRLLAAYSLLSLCTKEEESEPRHNDFRWVG